MGFKITANVRWDRIPLEGAVHEKAGNHSTERKQLKCYAEDLCYQGGKGTLWQHENATFWYHWGN